MRFTSFLFALPLLASTVFAAPTPLAGSKDGLIERGCTGGCGSTLDSVVAVFVDLKAEIEVYVPKVKFDVAADVDVAVTAVVQGCTTALAKLEADVDLKAKLALLTAVEKKIVAKAIADVVVDINAILCAVDSTKIQIDAHIKALISSCNSITAKLFLHIEGCISGVLRLALNICASFKISISPLFTCLTVDLSVYLKGIVGFTGGLVGGVLGLLGKH